MGTHWELKKKTNPPPCPPPQKKTMGASHYGLAIYIKKYRKAKEEIWKFKYLTV